MPFRKNEIPGFFSDPPPLTIEFEGKSYSARPDEPLSVTMLAHGHYVLGRSTKYHRPRGMYCGRGICSSCVAQVDGLPSLRTCQVHAHQGAKVESQHVMGTAKHDLLQAFDWLFPTAMDHHHLMTASSTLNRVAGAMARQLAGAGRLPEAVPVVREEPEQLGVDVAVIGAGAAGCVVAAIAEKAGLEVVLFDYDPGVKADQVRTGHVVGYYDDKTLLAVENSRQVRIHARAIVLASGALELRPHCPGNDLPGVFARRAVERMLQLGVRPGERAVIAVDPDADPDTRQAARQLLAELKKAEVKIAAEVGLDESGARKASPGPIVSFDGTTRLRRVHLGAANKVVDCDCVVWCSRPVPDYTLARQMGLDAPLDAQVGGFVPVCDADGRTARRNLFIAGEAAGVLATQARAHGERVAKAIVQSLQAAGSQGATLP